MSARNLTVVAFFMLFLLSGIRATAQTTTYYYTGYGFSSVQPPYTTQDQVTVSFTLDNPLPAGQVTCIGYGCSIGFSTSTISDGILGHPVLQALIATDSEGQIQEWNLFAGATSPNAIATCRLGSQITTCGNGDWPYPQGTYDWAEIYESNQFGCSNLPCVAFNSNTPGTWASSATPVPINFQQVQYTGLPNGTLQTIYSWQSSDGSIADLKNCQIEERVHYAGLDPFDWPIPWYGSVDNPTKVQVDATQQKLKHGYTCPPSTGCMSDSNYPVPRNGGWLPPIDWESNGFVASQDFGYTCSSRPFVPFPGWTKLLIKRQVKNPSDDNYCYYISKFAKKYELGKAFAPLPGIPRDACKGK
jgi:hypothetical protein